MDGLRPGMVMASGDLAISLARHGPSKGYGGPRPAEERDERSSRDV